MQKFKRTRIQMAALVELNSDLSKLTKTAIKKEIHNVEFKDNITKFRVVLQEQYHKLLVLEF